MYSKKSVAPRMGPKGTPALGHVQKYEAGFWQSVDICTVCYIFSHIFRPKNAMVNEFGQPFTKKLYCNIFEVLNKRLR